MLELFVVDHERQQLRHGIDAVEVALGDARVGEPQSPVQAFDLQGGVDLPVLPRPFGGGALQRALDRADRDALLGGDLHPAFAAGDARENFAPPKPPRLAPFARRLALRFALGAGGGLHGRALRGDSEK